MEWGNPATKPLHDVAERCTLIKLLVYCFSISLALLKQKNKKKELVLHLFMYLFVNCLFPPGPTEAEAPDILRP